MKLRQEATVAVIDGPLEGAEPTQGHGDIWALREVSGPMAIHGLVCDVLVSVSDKLVVRSDTINRRRSTVLSRQAAYGLDELLSGRIFARGQKAWQDVRIIVLKMTDATELVK